MLVGNTVGLRKASSYEGENNEGSMEVSWSKGRGVGVFHGRVLGYYYQVREIVGHIQTDTYGFTGALKGVNIRMRGRRAMKGTPWLEAGDMEWAGVFSGMGR